MAEETFTLRVFTPAGLQVEARVSEATVPTSNGEIGVLAKHARYTGIVGTGILQYSGADKAKNRIVVSGGFASFSSDVLTILADAVFVAETLDKTAYAKDRAELERLVQNSSTYSVEWQTAHEKLQRVEAIDTLLLN
jgi:F-type H+-transporting ATPase subunit epsilon